MNLNNRTDPTAKIMKALETHFDDLQKGIFNLSNHSRKAIKQMKEEISDEISQAQSETAKAFAAVKELRAQIKGDVEQ